MVRPEAASTTLCGVVRSKREDVEDNITKQSRRLIGTQVAAIVISALVAIFSYFAYEGTEDTCPRFPLTLKAWFAGMAISHLVATVLIALTLCSGLTVLDMQVKGLRARVAARTRSVASADPEPTPAFAPTPSPEPSPTPTPEPPTPTPTPPGPLEPPVPQPSVEYFTSMTMLFMSLLVFECCFLVVWVILGLISAISAASADFECDKGQVYFWILAACAVVNLCCFKILNCVDSHKRRRRLPVSEQSSIGDVGV